ncbi:MAG: hypothetical protein GWN84_00150 [Gammaproteobacteria bacterium]|nr:hypothetical protein [Gammaproteobacteria bacterium]NIR81616.1 hypothetical protein [Gammaproteobacteria bacterium]NIR88167.1 hypothetical protein [Gammaproteobacteria bacterium]NIU02728.1 hypothetical protein [Gammaproteobacteria bacterium]NIV73327.1 hypothetical protein [Gammaproteobacteria bacterium]
MPSFPHSGRHQSTEPTSNESARGRDPRTRPSKRRALWRTAVLAALVVLLAALAFVVVVLPDLVAQRQARVASDGSEAAQTAQQAPPVTAAPEPDTSSVARRRAGAVLGDVLRMQTVLREERVEIWASEAFAAASRRVAASDTAFADGRFADALDGYSRALEALRAIHESRDERLRRALAAGAAAIEAGDGEAAARQFRVALAVDPDDARAQAGLERARIIVEVGALLAEGRRHEASGDEQRALDAYRRALELDPQAAEARTAAERISARIDARRFREAMSAGLEALAAGRFDAARQALERARALKPDSPALADAMARLEEAATRARIRRRLDEARRLEREERWGEALAAYEQVLAVDDSVQSAQTGARRADELARLHARLDRYLDDPSRLTSDQPLQAAMRLQDAARAMENRGERLERKLGMLDVLIERALTPVPVTFVSDNRTEVLLYRVGNLGRFEQRELMLRPGRYTALGRRPGYRDVRLEFRLNPGQGPETLVVRCEEPI